MEGTADPSRADETRKPGAPGAGSASLRFGMLAGRALRVHARAGGNCGHKDEVCVEFHGKLVSGFDNKQTHRHVVVFREPFYSRLITLRCN